MVTQYVSLSYDAMIKATGRYFCKYKIYNLNSTPNLIPRYFIFQLSQAIFFNQSIISTFKCDLLIVKWYRLQCSLPMLTRRAPCSSIEARGVDFLNIWWVTNFIALNRGFWSKTECDNLRKGKQRIICDWTNWILSLSLIQGNCSKYRKRFMVWIWK